MAQINTAAFVKARSVNYAVKVGNNRTAYRSKDGTMKCFLYDHEIANVRNNVLCLDPCGYFTTTTRQAMHDFIPFLTGRSDIRVSFAKGEFTVTTRDKTYSPEPATGRVFVDLTA